MSSNALVVNMSQVMNNMLKGMMNNVTSQVVEACALKYGFSSEEALRELGVTLSVSSAKKLGTKKSSSEKKKTPGFPLPFSGEHDNSLCQALRQNNGLYTQCQAIRKEEETFCKSCTQLANKSEDGVPEYGTITKRLSVDIFSYIDPKGRKPIAYTKVMKKYKITSEQVLEEASKFGININPKHFDEPEKTKRGRPASEPKEPKEPKGSKGRPKKTNKVVQIEDDDDDLFASLVASADECNETEKAEKAEKIALEKAEKAEKIALEKAEKAEKAEKIAVEKAEKAEKIALEKAEKAEKIALEKAEKEAKLAIAKAEKEAKLAIAKAEKEVKLAKAEEDKAEKANKLASAKAEKETTNEETYKRCGEINGIKYIRSQQTGIVYDFNKYTESEELYAVGKWNTEEKKVVFNSVNDAELSDEEIDHDED
jgi:hypothetical protein